MPEPVSVVVLSHSWKSKLSEKEKEMMREGRRQSPHIPAGTQSDINKLKDRLINVRGFNRGHYDKRKQGEMLNVGLRLLSRELKAWHNQGLTLVNSVNMQTILSVILLL